MTLHQSQRVHRGQGQNQTEPVWSNHAGRWFRRLFHLLTILGLFTGLLVLFVAAVQGAEKTGPLAADLVSDGQGIDLASTRYVELFQELREKYGFAEEELQSIFRGVKIKRRVLELMDKQWEVKPYYEYRTLFITPEKIRDGQEKLAVYKDLLDRVEKELGVEREIVVAIWGIETKFGEKEGAFNVFQSLNTLFDAYPRRSDFFREQLIAFVLLCRETHIDPAKINGSYAGAFGQTQFMPSSFREYAIDFNGDGLRDVWETTADVLASIANYLHRYHWQLGAPIYHELGTDLKGEELVNAFNKGRKGFVDWQEVRRIQDVALPAPPDEGKLTIVGLETNSAGAMRYVAGYPNFQAITAWNNSNRYAMAVTELAGELKKTPSRQSTEER